MEGQQASDLQGALHTLTEAVVNLQRYVYICDTRVLCARALVSCVWVCACVWSVAATQRTVYIVCYTARTTATMKGQQANDLQGALHTLTEAVVNLQRYVY